MMKSYQFQLDEGSKKFHCPACGKKRFVRYVNTKDESYLPEKYGRCDREESCGYHRTPYEDDYEKSNWERTVKPKPKKQVKFVPVELFKRTQGNYRNNSFVKYLLSLFDKKIVETLIEKYHIGSTKNGGCIFYQIDILNKVRRGKVMHYASNGHRNKNRFNSVHAIMGWNENKYRLPDWRFFGEHLLRDSNKPVGIVESEKTAIIASVYLPQLTWLATGTKGTLKSKYAQSLKNRTIVLYPDIGAFDDWNKNADPFREFCSVSISTLLEDKATSKARDKGYDLADYLISFNVTNVRHTKPPKEKESRSNGKYNNHFNVNLNKKGYPASWDAVSLQPDTIEFKEATRIALLECDTIRQKQQLKNQWKH